MDRGIKRRGGAARRLSLCTLENPCSATQKISLLPVCEHWYPHNKPFHPLVYPTTQKSRPSGLNGTPCPSSPFPPPARPHRLTLEILYLEDIKTASEILRDIAQEASRPVQRPVQLFWKAWKALKSHKSVFESLWMHRGYKYLKKSTQKFVRRASSTLEKGSKQYSRIRRL